MVKKVKKNEQLIKSLVQILVMYSLKFFELWG